MRDGGSEYVWPTKDVCNQIPKCVVDIQRWKNTFATARRNLSCLVSDEITRIEYLSLILIQQNDDILYLQKKRRKKNTIIQFDIIKFDFNSRLIMNMKRRWNSIRFLRV